jgi:RHS repeat-associated protein
MTLSVPLFTFAQSPNPFSFDLRYHSEQPMFPSFSSDMFGQGWTNPFSETMGRIDSASTLLYRRTAYGAQTIYQRVGSSDWDVQAPANVTEHITKVGNEYRVTDLDGKVTAFDATLGHWLSTTDRWGNLITAGYGVTGVLQTVTDSEGRQITFSTDSSGKLVMTLPNGATWRFEFSGAKLVSIYDPLHTGSTPWRTFTYQFGTNGYPLLTAMKDDGGAVLEAHEYDSRERAITSSSGNNGDILTLQYDYPSAGMTRVTQALDGSNMQITDFTIEHQPGQYLPIDVLGSCTSCGRAGDHEHYTFNSSSLLISKTDSVGNVTTYSHNANGTLNSKTEAFGTALSRTTQYAYGMASWPRFVTSVMVPGVVTGQWVTTTSSWDTAETALTTTITGRSDPAVSALTTYTTTQTFDSRHRLLTTDGPRTDLADVTAATYYSDTDANVNLRGRLHTITDAAGMTQTFEDYDVYGTPRIRTDVNGVQTEVVRDLKGRVTSSTSLPVAGNPLEVAPYTSAWTFDSRDRLAETTRPRGNRARYVYEDGTNRRIDTVVMQPDGTGGYLEVERLHRILDAVGNSVQEHKESCTTPADPCTSWITKWNEGRLYDTNNRLTMVVRSDGAMLHYTYDANGRTWTIQDENHTTPNSTYLYDELSRLKNVSQALAGATGGTIVTSYGYDPMDNLMSVQDPNGNTTAYSYDDFHRMRKQSSPVTGDTAYTYDAVGNLLSTLDANGSTTTRIYDALNRVLSSTAARSGTASETTSWTYDDTTAADFGKGRLASMTDPSGATTYRYERRGLLRYEQKVVDSVSFTSQYAYDANGNRSSITYPSGRIVNYTFDYADRPLSAISGTTTYVSNATYLPFGPQNSMSFGNGTSQTMQYDTRYIPLENTLATGATPLIDYSYTKDLVGNITAIHDVLDPTYNRDFGYDDLNRLVSANSGTSLWGTGAYSYDAMGNMKTLQLGTVRSATFSYSGTLPKLTSVTENSTARAVTYDAAGNEVAVGSSLMTISPRNEVIVADDSHYVYDGRGVRTSLSRPSLTLSLAPSAIVNRSTSTGTLMLAAAAPVGGATVTLSSSNTSIVTVPATITLAAGVSSTTFTINSYDVPSTTAADVIATYAGTTVSASVTVQPFTVQVSSLTFSPADVTPSARTTTGTVTLTAAAPTGGAHVLLSTPQVLVGSPRFPAPAYVDVSPGQTSATFAATGGVAVGSSCTGSGDCPTEIDVTAQLSASTTSAFTYHTVDDWGGIGELSLDEPSVPGGGNTRAVLSLKQPAPVGGTVVMLSSSDRLRAAVPSSVTVPAGATRAEFLVRTTARGRGATIRIMAATAQWSRAATLRVGSDDASPADEGQQNIGPTLLSLSLLPLAIAPGDVAEGTVTLDRAAPAGGLLVTLATGGSGVHPPPAIIVPEGGTFASFEVPVSGEAEAQTVTLTATAGSSSRSAELTISPTVTPEHPRPSRSSGGGMFHSFSFATHRNACAMSLGVTAEFATMRAQPLSAATTRKIYLYTPELNLMAETDVSSANTPAIAYEYIWFAGKSVAQVDVATNTTHWTFTDHLGTPIAQTNSSATIDWRVEYEPFGTVYAFRTGSTRHQPLRFPGQEFESLDGNGEREYNIFRWYRAAWGRYTQADPMGLHGGLNVYGYTKGNPIIDFDPLGLCCSNQDYYGQLVQAYSIAWSVQNTTFFSQLFSGGMLKRGWQSNVPNGCGLNADNLVQSLNSSLTCWRASRTDAGPSVLGFTCRKMIPHSYATLAPLNRCCDAKDPGNIALDNYYGWPNMAPFPDASKSPF